jgi:hypothetical protein
MNTQQAGAPTQDQFIKNSGHITPKLINSVINQFGGWETFTESAEHVSNHGINGGFGGWIYYTETHKFAMKNRKTIVELLEESAQSLGEDVVNMVSNFGVFRTSKMDNEDKKDLYRFLGGGRPSKGTITNVMAWFAAEEVCRAYSDMVYELENN